MGRYVALIPAAVEDAHDNPESVQAPLGVSTGVEPERTDSAPPVARAADTAPPRRGLPAGLLRRVAQRLRSGRPVLLETDYGPVVLAPSLDAARWVEERCPGAAALLPHEWRALADCEAPDEVEVLIA